MHTPTIDIAATFYKQTRHVDRFFWGVRENAEHINKVYIINDDWWEEGELMPIARYAEAMLKEFHVPVIPMQHEHVGHGVATSLNMALYASSADYMFCTAFDMILPPGTVSTLAHQAKPRILGVGAVHGIADDTPISTLPHPSVAYRRPIPDLAGYRQGRRLWRLGRTGHMLIWREGHDQIGGFNEEFCPLGYGLEDTEYAARWCVHFGLDSIAWLPTMSWHLGDVGQGARLADGTAKLPSEDANLLLVQTLTELYGPRYNLFCAKGAWPDHINVVDKSSLGPNDADVRLDCVRPDWIPPRSALTIRTHLGDPRHLKTLRRLLRPGGCIVLRGEQDERALGGVADNLGLTLDRTGDFWELSVEE